MRFIAILSIAVFSACALWAQTTNNQSILGTVQDSSGAIVPSATVTVFRVTAGVPILSVCLTIILCPTPQVNVA
jgi:DNA-binding transcriptional regulator of glucitol operon